MFVSKAVDIYTDYILNRFRKIDIDHPMDPLPDYNNNAGAKGEVILEPIVDISMWLFDYALESDYSIIPHHGGDQYTGYEGIDYRIHVKENTIDLEAKNYNDGWKLTPQQFKDNIIDRYDNDTSVYRALMIHQSHVNHITIECKKNNIDIISIPFFMEPWNNVQEVVSNNISKGIGQFTDIVSKITGDKPKDKQSHTIKECINLGMPYWFISKYLHRSRSHIKNVSTNMGAINRNTREWNDLNNYRCLFI